MIEMFEQKTRSKFDRCFCAVKRSGSTGGTIFHSSITTSEEDFRGFIQKARAFENQIPEAPVLTEKYMPKLVEAIRRS